MAATKLVVTVQDALEASTAPQVVEATVRPAPETLVPVMSRAPSPVFVRVWTALELEPTAAAGWEPGVRTAEGGETVSVPLPEPTTVFTCGALATPLTTPMVLPQSDPSACSSRWRPAYPDTLPRPTVPVP